jgi:hypothetical protein
MNLILIIYLIQSNSIVLFSYYMEKPAQVNGATKRKYKDTDNFRHGKYG